MIQWLQPEAVLAPHVVPGDTGMGQSAGTVDLPRSDHSHVRVLFEEFDDPVRRLEHPRVRIEGQDVRCGAARKGSVDGLRVAEVALFRVYELD
jgi:hypothetical protein